MDFLITYGYEEAKKCWNVALSGEIDIFNSNRLKTKLLELIEEKQGDLFLDCKELEYIDSTALGALVAVLRHVKAYEGQIHLQRIRPNLAKLFKITNLDKVFIIEGDCDVQPKE